MKDELDISSPLGQPCVNNFRSLYKLGRNEKDRGIWKSLPSSINNIDSGNMLVKSTLKKTKWILICSYNPHKDC